VSVSGLTNADRHTLQFGSRAERIAIAASLPILTYETEVRDPLAESLAVTPEIVDAVVERKRQENSEFRDMVAKEADQIRNGHADMRPFAPPEAHVDDPLARVNGKHAPNTAPMSSKDGSRIAEPLWYGIYEPDLARADAVDELLGAGALSMIYGGSGSGKTFFALDLALSIARGVEWRGKPVLRGIVLYAAGEGRRSVLLRERAYDLHHFEGDGAALPFATIPEAIDLLDPSAHVDAVVAIAKEAEENRKLPTVLIVIDTLARSIAGGNENAPEVMGTAIKTADRLRELTGAHVLLVHHTGKTEGNGARGHSSLRATLDTEIEVTGTDGVRIARVTKQRDFPIGATFAFALKPVVLGTNAKTGKEVTSCIVEHVDAPAQSGRRDPTSKNQAAFLAGLREFTRGKPPGTVIAPAELQQIAKTQGLKQRARLIEVRASLLKQGWIAETVGGIRLAEEAL